MSTRASLPRRFLPGAADAGLRMQLAVEPLGEGELLLVGERLVAEHEDRVRVHAGADLGERLGVGHLPQVDRADLGGERGMERAEPEGHARHPPCDGAVGSPVGLGGTRVRHGSAPPGERPVAAPIRS